MNKTLNSIASKTANWNIKLFLALLVGSAAIAFAVGSFGYLAGAIIFLLIVMIPVVAKSFRDPTFGLFFLIGYSYILFFIGRLLLPQRLPLGLGVEIIQIVLALGIVVGSFGNTKIKWDFFKNPVTYALIALECYNLLQALNPNAVSIIAWVAYVRILVFDLVLYFIIGNLIASKELVIRFTKFWLFLSLLAALYGIYQEFFGYQDFEWLDINSSPETIGLIQNGGFLRKFSFMSDVTTFGIVMAYSAIMCCVLAMGPLGITKRIILGGTALVLMVGMSYSGARTATAMIPMGLMMYILMNIQRKSTFLILVGLVFAFLALLFGPFYGSTATRLRTTFQPSKDASMNMREINRARIQPYIRSHPIGGGINTTDSEGKLLSPGHVLAGFPTDNGFLKTALTIGWVGLILQMTLYFIVISIGIKNYFLAEDPVIKSLYCGYIAMFFSLIIANFTQWSLVQKPTSILVPFIFILMPNLIKFDKSKRIISG